MKTPDIQLYTSGAVNGPMRAKHLRGDIQSKQCLLFIMYISILLPLVFGCLRCHGFIIFIFIILSLVVINKLNR